MSPSLLAVAGISLLLGFRHAFEPDHLAAVSTLATRQGSVLRASWLGIVWGLGHTASFGLLHGLAGSGAIIVLLVATVPTRTAQLAYLGAFGLGTIVGMLSVSLSLAAAVRLASRNGAWWATALHLGSATASVTVGVLLAWRMVSAL